MADAEPISTDNGTVEPQLVATIYISEILADGDDGTILQGQDTTVDGVMYTNGTLAYELPFQFGGGVYALPLFARSVSADGDFGQAVLIGDATITDTGQTYEGEEVYDWSANISTATLSDGIYDLEAFAYTQISQTFASDPNVPPVSLITSNTHPAFEYFNVVPSDDGTLPAAPIAADAGSGELSSDGRYFVFTNNSETYELDTLTGNETELANGDVPVGNFVPGQTIDSAALAFQSGVGNDLGSLVFTYSHTITSANGAYTLGAIGEDHPYIAQQYQPYEDQDYYTGYDAELFPTVTDNATGVTTLLTGFGTNESVTDAPEGIPVAISDDGTTVLVENDYLNGLGDEANSGYYIVHLPAASGTPLGDVFTDVSAASSGALAGAYLWSNPANWSLGEPGYAANATLAGAGIDDLSSLTLNDLDANTWGVEVVGGVLEANVLSIGRDAAFQVVANFYGAVQSTTAVINTIIGSGAFFDASGPNAELIINDVDSPAETYEVSDGGLIELVKLGAGDEFDFNDGGGTLALVTPGADISAELYNITAGDVLELPDAEVTGLSFGNEALSDTTLGVTTSNGIYVFSNVNFGGTVLGYSTAVDPTTGLEAITFSAASITSTQDVFQQSDEYNGAQPLDGVYFWSDDGNWAAGSPPSDGDSVVMNVQDGLDSIDSLSLSSLTLGSASTLDLIGEHLTIGEITGSGILIAQAGNVASDVTLTVDADTVTGDTAPLYGADGAGAVFIDNAVFNSGILFADGGGMLEITGAPGAAQLNYSAAFFGYYNGPSTIAFLQPGATVTAPLDFVTRQDVLELPGSAVSGAYFGAATMTIATNEGSTTFTNVDYGQSITGYTASFDTLTGLEAITFTGPASLDVFDGAAVQSVPPTLIGELWSSDENWEGIVPRNGDAVAIEYTGTGYDNALSLDDIANLSLSSLQVVNNAVLLIAAPLEVGSLTIAAGANLGDQSVLTVDGDTANDGQVGTDPTTIRFEGAVTGDGTISISAGSDVIFYGSVAALQSIEFLDSTGTLTLADPSQFNAQIIGSGVEDVVCYLRGTRIATPAGERHIEELEIGDLVVTRLGGSQAIKWIGRQSFDGRFIRRNSDQIPVRIAAGALGRGLPLRDLYVSPGHSMLLDGRLVLARHLINGITITQREIPAQVHYYQLEFDAHDCVLAEGAWSESYADCAGMRGRFHNAAEFAALYPEHLAPAEPGLCAWRPESGPGLERALRPIVAQAQAAILPGRLRGFIDAIEGGFVKGWAQDLDHPELPVLLYVFLGGEMIGTALACDARHDLREAGIGNGQCSFSFQLPVPLSPDAAGRLAMCRAGDGAALAMSRECRSSVTMRAA